MGDTEITTQMFVASVLVAGSFYAVLCFFLWRLARSLGNIAGNLATVSSGAAGISDDCQRITPAIDGMNQNLYNVAAQLSDLGDAAEAVWTPEDS